MVLFGCSFHIYLNQWFLLMSLKIVLLLLALAVLGGTAAGYALRLLVLRARKGSLENEIKNLLLDAREDAKRITEDAEAKAKEVVAVAETALAEKEDKLAKQEE